MKPDGDAVPAGSPRLFVSHATADAELASRLTDELTARGSAVWLATTALRVGENYAEVIYDHIRSCDFVVVLISYASIESPHVRREVNIAVDLHRPLLPISVQPGIIGSPELPLDWRYWLGIVQIYSLTTVADVVDAIQGRVAAHVKPHHGPVRYRVPNDSPVPEDEVTRTIRTSLIQVAARGLPFGIVLQRCRHLRCGRNRIEDVTRQLKESGLVMFEEPLLDTTSITLTD